VASAFSHAVAALSIGTCFYGPQTTKRVSIAGAVCSVIPDLDVIGFRFGVHYGDFWGHRGFTHSLVFAALLSGAVAVILSRRGSVGIARFSLFAYLFFSPFDNRRYFLPWRPIRVSPVSVTRFFSSRGYAVLQSELLWIWVPAAVFAASILALRRVESARTTVE
jgi:inner membrane protein